MSKYTHGTISFMTVGKMKRANNPKEAYVAETANELVLDSKTFNAMPAGNFGAVLTFGKRKQNVYVYKRTKKTRKIFYKPMV